MKLHLFKILVVNMLFLYSCGCVQKGDNEKPVARVMDLLLYPSDLMDQVPDGVSVDDSIRIARRLIEEWVRDKLMLKKAEQYLSGVGADVEKQVQDYRASLLTFKYKQEVLAQRLDTVIHDEDVEEYYVENSSNYVLNTDVVRLTYVRLPLDTPDVSLVRRLYRSERDEDLANLEQYCNAYAESFIIKSQKWYRFADFILNTPFRIESPGRFLLYNKSMETRDELSHYFIHIFEHIPERKTAPLEMVYNDIRSVLLNKRKITIMQDLETSVYREGLSRNMAEIYK